MAGEYAFTLEHVGKQHGSKTILEDVNLSFFFGARIGVIGANGSGKSSLLRILAGIDKDIVGQVHVAPSARIGYLEQEPQMDLTKTVSAVVAEGVAEAQAKLDRYDEICGLLGEVLTDEDQDQCGSIPTALASLGVGDECLSDNENMPCAGNVFCIDLDGDSKGLVLTRVAENSAASRARLKPGDQILQIERQPVATLDDASRLISAHEEATLLLLVRSGELSRFVVLEK